MADKVPKPPWEDPDGGSCCERAFAAMQADRADAQSWRDLQYMVEHHAGIREQFDELQESIRLAQDA